MATNSCLAALYKTQQNRRKKTNVNSNFFLFLSYFLCLFLLRSSFPFQKFSKNFFLDLIKAKHREKKGRRKKCELNGLN